MCGGNKAKEKGGACGAPPFAFRKELVRSVSADVSLGVSRVF